MVSGGSRLSVDQLKALEQTVRNQGEQYVISISVADADHAAVSVGDGTFFRGSRLYNVVRDDGAWRVESVVKIESS